MPPDPPLRFAEPPSPPAPDALIVPLTVILTVAMIATAPPPLPRSPPWGHTGVQQVLAAIAYHAGPDAVLGAGAHVGAGAHLPTARPPTTTCRIPSAVSAVEAAFMAARTLGATTSSS